MCPIWGNPKFFPRKPPKPSLLRWEKIHGKLQGTHRDPHCGCPSFRRLEEPLPWAGRGSYNTNIPPSNPTHPTQIPRCQGKGRKWHLGWEKTSVDCICDGFDILIVDDSCLSFMLPEFWKFTFWTVSVSLIALSRKQDTDKCIFDWGQRLPFSNFKPCTLTCKITSITLPSSSSSMSDLYMLPLFVLPGWTKISHIAKWKYFFPNDSFSEPSFGYVISSGGRPKGIEENYNHNKPTCFNDNGYNIAIKKPAVNNRNATIVQENTINTSWFNMIHLHHSRPDPVLPTIGFSATVRRGGQCVPPAGGKGSPRTAQKNKTCQVLSWKYSRMSGCKMSCWFHEI